MINVGVLNNKLFFRAINLVRQFARADYETGEPPRIATIALLPRVPHQRYLCPLLTPTVV